MELLGLAFVVVLITLGLLFYIKFQAAKQPSTAKKTFTESQKASNLLNSLLKTNTYCEDATLTQLLQDCAEHKVPSSQIDCDGYTSCEFANRTIAYIFQQTLEEWKNDYFLEVCLWNTITQQCLPDETLFTLPPLTTGCSGQRESSSQFIPTSSGVLKIWLDICY